MVRAFIQVMLVVGPTVLAGAAVILLGVRGRKAWASPYCRRCGYDLRGAAIDAPGAACTECGAPLDARRAVCCVALRRHWGTIALGVVLLILPALIGTGVSTVMYVRSRAGGVQSWNLQPATNDQLLAFITDNAEDYQGWRELEQRITANRLDAAETDRALRVLVDHLKAAAPDGYDRPLHEMSNFVAAAQQRGWVSDAALADLIDALLGPTPRFRPIDRLHAGRPQQINYEIVDGSSWIEQSYTGLPYALLRHVKAVRVDGEPAAPLKHRGWTSDGINGSLALDLPPGTHHIEADIELALVDPQQLPGGQAYDVKRDQWPAALKRHWTLTAGQTFTVLADDEHPVKAATRSALDPGGALQLTDALVRPESGRLKLVLRFAVDPAREYQGALAFDVKAQLPGRAMPVEYGLTYRSATDPIHHGTNTRTSGMQHEAYLDAPLDPSVRTIDVTLTPNPALQDHDPLVTEVWARPIVLKNVELRRYDAE